MLALDDKKVVTIKQIALTVLLLTIALNGIVPQSILVLIEAPLMIYLALTEYGYLVYPITFYYYYQLGMFMGISVYRLFSLAFIFNVILNKHFTIKKRIPSLIILGVFFIYNLLVLSLRSLQIAFFSFIDLFGIFLLVTTYLEDEECLRKFVKIFIVVSALAVLTGLIDKNSIETAWATSNTVINLSRFQATFEDPNYMGYFYNVAIFALVIFKPFKKNVNILLIICFSIAILSTLSMTAIIGNILFWLVYLCLTKKISLNIILLAIAVICGAVILYNYGLSHFDVPIIGQLAFRINEKISAFLVKDWGIVTTNRSNLLESHFQLFTNQSITKILFGGNVVSPYMVDLPGASAMAHNDYIDTLINVGVVGGATLLLSCLYQTCTHLKIYKKECEDIYIFRIMNKCVWFYYLSTLTVFLDFRFMMGLFI